MDTIDTGLVGSLACPAASSAAGDQSSKDQDAQTPAEAGAATGFGWCSLSRAVETWSELAVVGTMKSTGSAAPARCC